MNEFIKQLQNEEMSGIEKAFPVIDSVISALQAELDLPDNDIRYDQGRKTFVVPVRKEAPLFAIITHDSRTVSVEMRKVNNEAQTEDVIAVLGFNTASGEIMENKQLNKLAEVYESAFITDLFWKLTEFTREKETPKEEPTEEVLQPDEIK